MAVGEFYSFNLKGRSGGFQTYVLALRRWRNWSRLNYASWYLSDINRLLQSGIFPYEVVKSQIQALELNPDLTPTAAPYQQGIIIWRSLNFIKVFVNPKFEFSVQSILPQGAL